MNISGNLDPKRLRGISVFVLTVTFLVLQPYSAKAELPKLPEIPDFNVFWKVPLLPLSIRVGPDGVNVQGEASIATPIGTFGVETTDSILEKEREGTEPLVINDVRIEKQDLLLVIRNTNQWGDKIYKIEDGKELSVFADGYTLITAKDGSVIVDVSNGSVQEINFAGKTEIPAHPSDQTASNQTVSDRTASDQNVPNQSIPVELKLLHQDRADKNFKPLAKNGTLHSGDLYKLVFRTPEDAYVYIFNTDDRGKFVRVFPMKSFKDVTVNNANPAKADTAVTIPASAKSFRLDADTGTGKIVYLAVKKSDPRLEHQDFAQGDTAASVLEYLNSVYKDCLSTVTFTHK